MKRFLLPLSALILTVAISSCTSGSGYKNEDIIPTEELEQLNSDIADADKYYAQTKNQLDSIVKIASDPATENSLAVKLFVKAAHEMSVLNADTALLISDAAMKRAEPTGSDSIKTAAEIARLNSLTSAGIFSTAEKELISLNGKKMPLYLRTIFWQVARQLYANMSLYSSTNFALREEFSKKSAAYDDSLIANLNPSTPFRKFLISERMVTSGDYKSARQSLENLISSTKDDPHILAMAYYQMALIEKNTGNERDYGRWMAKAADCDIRGSVRDGLALFSLANWLYEKGEITDAFHYINFALQQAMAGDARMRAVNIVSMLPMIDDTYRQTHKKSHDRMTILIIICSLLLLILGTSFFLLYMSRKHYIKAEQRLKTLSRSQEVHLANFLSLCSSYMHKLNALEKLVQRKIASGQTNELLKIIKSGKYSEGDDSIFEIFDRYFLETYPDFIEQINSLLRPEECYDMRSDALHPELRIYALVRMGITESSRIALILDYSANTIYAYRNKMRNKAINRETFDRDVVSLSLLKDNKIHNQSI